MMTYSINHIDPNNVCEIVLTGEVSAEDAIAMLDEVWRDDAYKDSRIVLWDVERRGTFPDFNQFMSIVNHFQVDKPAHGPQPYNLLFDHFRKLHASARDAGIH